MNLAVLAQFTNGGQFPKYKLRTGQKSANGKIIVNRNINMKKMTDPAYIPPDFSVASKSSPKLVMRSVKLKKASRPQTTNEEHQRWGFKSNCRLNIRSDIKNIIPKALQRQMRKVSIEQNHEVDYKGNAEP